MKRQTIIAGASIMMVAALLSRVLGYVREKTIGYYWGVGPQADPFWAAFMVPDLLYYLLAGGAVGAAVIPVFAGYLRRGEERESWRVANTIITLFTGCAVIGAALIAVFALPLVTLVAPGFAKNRDLGPEATVQCARYVRILAPMIIFTVTSAFITGILQAHRHFTAPALAWLVYNVGIIGGAFVGGIAINHRLGDPTGLVGPAVGVVIGSLLLVAVQLPSLAARGFRYRPRLELQHPGVREVLKLFLPYMAGLAFTQICLLWLPSFFGSWFSGGVSSLRYANRLVVMPLSLFGVSISTAVFPTLAEEMDAGRIAEFRRTFSGALRAVLILSVPSAAALFALAGPISRLLWKGGSFGESGIAAAEYSLLFYVASLIGLSGLQIVNRAFYSLRDIRTPPLVGIGYTLLTVALAIALMRTRLQYAAIAAGTSIGVTVGMLVLFELLRRRLQGIEGRAITLSFLRTLVAAVALAVVAHAVSRWLGGVFHVPSTQFALSAPEVVVGAPVHGWHLTGVALQVLASLAAGAVSYLLVLHLLGAPELKSFREAIRRRRTATASVPVE
jgi:putative peptidoglycan lipid II flippase